MKHIKLLIIVFFLFSGIRVPAQTLKSVKFGTGTWCNPLKVWQIPDGNIASVASQQNANGTYSTFLYQFDSNGAQLSAHPLPSQSASRFVEPSADGSTFFYGRMGVAGYTIYRMNLTGQPLDSIFFLPAEPLWDDYSFAIRMAPNGDFVFALEDLDPPQGVRVVRMTQQGVVVFNKYTASNDPEFYNNCLAVLPDGRTAVAIIDFTQGYRVMCFSPTGALLWQKGVPQIPPFPEEFQLIPMDNGNLAFIGPDGSANGALSLGYAGVYKPDGSFAYSRVVEQELPNFECYKGIADGDQLVLVGNYHIQGLEYGLGVLKLDATGQVLFRRKFNLLSGQNNFSANKALNGDYVFSSFQWRQVSLGTYQSDKAYVLSLQPDGALNWFASEMDMEPRYMDGFCHLANGDMVFLGESFDETPGGNILSVLLRVSDIGPLYTNLIRGKIAFDSIPDCLVQPVEPSKSGWRIKATGASGPRYAFSDSDGNYRIRLADAAAQVETEAPNALWDHCANSYPVSFATGSTVDLSIPVKAVADCPLFSLQASSIVLRRCFDNTLYLRWCNNGTVAAENVLLTVELDPYFSYTGSSLPLASQNGHLLYFNLGEVPAGQCGSMTINVLVSCLADLGQLHCFNARLQVANDCSNFPGMPSAQNCQQNVGAYDPNDIRAFVADTLKEGVIPANTSIKYQIRFQNTGTDTAFNIMILDTLPAALDFNTLRFAGSSHPCQMQWLDNRILKFTLNDIRLPHQAVNEPGSHGFLEYYIDQQPDLPKFTRIRNAADIYFDFNQAVRTNTHELVIGAVSDTGEPVQTGLAVLAYPNPASDGPVWLRVSDRSIRMVHVILLDATGRILSECRPQLTEMALTLPQTRGVYLAKVLLETGEWVPVRIIR